MFLDKVKIHVQSGAGGNGMVAWRREKYVPHGGPAGGDGGRGGDVFIEATDDLNTLLDFKYMSIFKAVDGGKGRIKNQHGRGGDPIVIKVPCGTIIRDVETKQAIADLKKHGDRVLVAGGGRGGRGNSRFTSAVRQSPQFSEPGEPGIERELELELKLIADVGIIGFPNAGKSTFISVVSAAKPKIADYPFTTLTPNLGVVKKPDGDGVVIADIPGLIEGASAGLGLGHDFLRHVERTRLLIHLVAVSGDEDLELPTSEDVIHKFRIINNELKQFRTKLAEKPQIIVLSKVDTLPDDMVIEFQKALSEFAKSPVHVISSVTRHGVDGLLNDVFKMLDTIPPDDQVVELVPDLKALDHDDSYYEVRKQGKVYVVDGGKVERLVAVTDMKNSAAVHRLMNILKAMGVYESLEQHGAVLGDVVVIAGMEFEYAPEH
ncbi:MAG: GTPase ObgE [Cyanobacteria bacterium]|nr:GTPase ObgE [Cyanobacteriota bacterium]